MSTLLTHLTARSADVNSDDMKDDDRPYHHGDLRSEIERIAWDVVASEGMEKLSLRACARTANVDPAAVYRHFKSKDAILSALARRAFVDLANRLEAAEDARAQGAYADRLLHIGLAYIDYATENPAVFRMMFDLAGRVPVEEFAGVSGTGRNAYQILQDALARWLPGLDAGEVQALSFTLWSAVHGQSFLFISGLGPEHETERAKRAEQVCRTVLEGCRLHAQD